MSRVSVIGAGFSGLSAACVAAKSGHRVDVFEKNSDLGGRARKFSASGFVFDMGPSWYWMPDVIERFFNHFGRSTTDYYQLVQLDPGFRMFFGKNDVLDISADLDELKNKFESIEPGSSKKLDAYLKDAAFKYAEGMLNFAYKPSLSWLEYAKPSLLINGIRLKMHISVSAHVKKYFKDPRLIALMEFPSLFLGAMPWQIPSLYTMMNYAALEQGTWYPMGGMFKIVDAMASLANSLGVTFHTSSGVSGIAASNKKIHHIIAGQNEYATDAVIGACDYHHLEQHLLGSEYSNYNEEYWNKKTFAPSCLLFYIGVNKKLKNLVHHNLFFDTDLQKHAKEIYEKPEWPAEPLFYVCCPSVTDASVAPEGHENLFVLMPVSTELKDDESRHDYYYHMLLERMEFITGQHIKEHIVYKKSYAINQFMADYNAYKGNAYGLANTLAQTAFLKPAMKNKKLENLFYAGQLTVPGPGVPPCIISGQIAAKLTNNYLKK